MMRTLPGARRIAGATRAAQRAVSGEDAPHRDFPEAPRTRFNGPLTNRRSLAFGSVPVADVRAAKTAHGVSFNDLVVAAVAGGVRRRLRATGDLPEQPLLAFVPANVRTDAQSTDGGNAISSYVVEIPTNLDDGSERVRAAGAALTAAKDRHATTPPTLMDDANVIVPPAVFGVFARSVMRIIGAGTVAPPLNLLLSNVPGPPVQVYLDGAPLERFAPFSLIFAGAALNVTVISYAKRLEIGVVGDRELVPDAWELVADIEAEFAELFAAA
jgi:WS/DGAT/MGAT family acyltransferase